MDNTTLIVGLILAVLLIYVIQRIGSLGKRLDAMESPGEAALAPQPVYQAPTAIAAGDEQADIAAAIAAVMLLLDNEAMPSAEDGLIVRRIRREGVRAPKWRLHDANQ